MKVSVVIPVHNEEDYLPKCLDSLAAQTDRPEEIIVVNNNSTDSSRKIAEKYAGVRIIDQPEPGIIPTRNMGFDSAAGEIIARCDADTIVPPDWVANIRKTFESDERIVAVSTSVASFDMPLGKKLSGLFAVYMLMPRIIIGHFPLVGPSMSVRKTAWLRIRDGLCRNASAVHEDLDVSFHIRKLGEVRHIPKTVVQSSGRRVMKRPWSFFGEYTLRFIRMLPKHMFV